VYQRTARLALHRHLNGDNKPFIETHNLSGGRENLYGLGAGDTELVLDVVKADNDEMINSVINELQYEGMVGPKNELLPRLQNLQADLPIIGDTHQERIIPIYRYPGNYSGMEWPTHPWSPTTLAVKRSVEEALKPLYIQSMNHCVTNLYRDGTDRIDHHSDKDLDLNQLGVIVSVSLGSARVMEVRDRIYPHDVAHVELPPGSMLVLGPETNARFTHSVLPIRGDYKENCNEKKVNLSDIVAKCIVNEGGRISLTFRDVRTFLDVKSLRLFGQGVSSSCDKLTLDEDGAITEESLTKAVRSMRKNTTAEQKRSAAFALVFGATLVASSKRQSTKTSILHAISTLAISTSVAYLYLQRARRVARQNREEVEARQFFSKKSASGTSY